MMKIMMMLQQTNNCGSWIIFIIFILQASCLLLLPSNVHGSKAFQWQASLDATTGVARSVEVATFTTTTITKTAESFNPRQEQKLAATILKQMVEEYPSFLTKPQITLGLMHNHKINNATALQTRVFPCNMLKFGTIQTASSSTLSLSKTFVQFKLPIIGGLLALSTNNNDDKNDDKSSLLFSNIFNKNKRHSNEHNNDFGRLEFEMTHQQQPKLNNKNNGGSGIENQYTLTTRIAGNYCPTIAGRAPVSAIRKWTYLHSQSYMHAYVMWSFSRKWKKEMQKLSQTNK